MTPFDPDRGRDWCARSPAEAVEHDEVALSRLRARVRWVEWDTVCVWCLEPIRDGGCQPRACRHRRREVAP